MASNVRMFMVRMWSRPKKVSAERSPPGLGDGLLRPICGGEQVGEPSAFDHGVRTARLDAPLEGECLVKAILASEEKEQCTRILVLLSDPGREQHEVSMLALHLLQSALVHVNTLLLQNVLDSSDWDELLGPDERRGLSPLFWSNINPYGHFRLDLTKRLELPTPSR